MKAAEQISISGWLGKLVVTGVQLQHTPVVPKQEHETLFLGGGDKNTYQKRKGQPLEYKQPELPKCMGFLQHKRRLHNEDYTRRALLVLFSHVHWLSPLGT